MVVPTYNRAQVLPGALESLAAQETQGRFEFEVVVVDNGSSDSTAEVLAQLTAPFRAFCQPHPGESWARNLGVEMSRGQWIAFLDDDEVAQPDWLFHLWEQAMVSQCLVVAGPVLLDLPQAQAEELGPHCRQLLGECGWPTSRILLGNDFPACCNALVHRSVFESIGRFNPDLTVASDTDFFVRARRAGLSGWFSPRPRVRQAVPPQRLNRDFLLSRALWQGAYFALLMGQGRSWPTLRIAFPRVVKAVLMHAPCSLWERVRGRYWRGLGHQAMVWRAWGCVRAALAVTFPAQLSQGKFFGFLKNQARAGRGQVR